MSKQDVPAGKVAKDAVSVAATAVVGTAVGGPVGGLIGGVAAALYRGLKYHTNPEYHKEDDEDERNER